MRADTTLIGFDQNDWQRGNRSYVFKGGGNCDRLNNLSVADWLRF